MAEADPRIAGIAPPAPCVSSAERGHILRSQLLDAFARVELAVAALSASADIVVSSTAAFSQRISALKKGKDAFHRPAAIDNLVIEAGEASKLRSTVVHAEMCIAEHRQETIFIFRNVADLTHARTLTEADFKSETSKLRNLANRVSQQRLKAPAPAAPASSSAPASPR